MILAPRLGEADIRIEVERIFKKRNHRSKLVALHGTGEAGRFDYDGLPWEVIPTTCELDLRAKLPRAGAPADGGQVFLVDWEDSALPVDIQCRMAGGRLYHIAQDARLLSLFGARQADPALVGSGIAKLFLSGALPQPRKLAGLRLTRDDLVQAFLQARFELGAEDLASPLALLRWVRRRDSGPAFLRAASADDGLRAARRELLDWIAGTARLGPLGVLTWRAFEEGAVERMLQVALLGQAVAEVEDPYLRGLFGGRSAGWLPSLQPELRAAEAQVSNGALFAGLLTPAEEDQRLLESAEALATEVGLSALVARSEWLPGGHVAREAAFAERLASFARQPSAAGLDSALTALDHLESHRGDALRTAGHREARQMLARLAAWLWTRRARPLQPAHGTAWQPAVDLARRYAEEGGALDWARQSVRTLRASPELEAAARELSVAVASERREDDRRFAEAYVAWVEAGRPSGEVLPIEQVAQRVIAPFARERSRKLLVILMDGMSHAALAQLMARLRVEKQWGPIAWRLPGWTGLLPLPPVLAAAPTLTEVSRAAFFAGEADPRFGDQGTVRDEQRWANNRAVRQLMPEEDARLFFRADIRAGLPLPDDLKKVVASEQQLVAVVINAVDEQLKGSFQVSVDYAQSSIHPLENLISEAEGAERAVLLAADHGHVPGEMLSLVTGRVGPGRVGGARWRALAEGEQPEPDEVVLPATTWRPRGYARVAVLWDAGVCHRSPHHGEHGGLSLAEAVAPAVLLAHRWLERVFEQDDGLRAVTFPEPAWWSLRVPPAQEAIPARPPPEGGRQLPLLEVAAAPPPLAPERAPAAPAEPPLVAELRASRVFKDQIRGVAEAEVERVLGWLGVLVRAGGTVPAEEFARLCGVLAHQVGGVVARMGVLNADGYAIVEHDLSGRRVLLHRARLAQQYGVSP